MNEGIIPIVWNPPISSHLKGNTKFALMIHNPPNRAVIVTCNAHDKLFSYWTCRSGKEDSVACAEERVMQEKESGNEIDKKLGLNFPRFVCGFNEDWFEAWI